ncbi:MAG: 4-alpha-glucanotransferase, partial [Candidatus Omnitrophica bacterium]|nr:4-alpha-glucanotransferase [Candidatus Omnitrophota bacterium]
DDRRVSSSLGYDADRELSMCSHSFGLMMLKGGLYGGLQERTRKEIYSLLSEDFDIRVFPEKKLSVFDVILLWQNVADDILMNWPEADFKIRRKHEFDEAVASRSTVLILEWGQRWAAYLREHHDELLSDIVCGIPAMRLLKFFIWYHLQPVQLIFVQRKMMSSRGSIVDRYNRRLGDRYLKTVATALLRHNFPVDMDAVEEQTFVKAYVVCALRLGLLLSRHNSKEFLSEAVSRLGADHGILSDRSKRYKFISFISLLGLIVHGPWDSDEFFARDIKCLSQLEFNALPEEIRNIPVSLRRAADVLSVESKTSGSSSSASSVKDISGVPLPLRASLPYRNLLVIGALSDVMRTFYLNGMRELMGRYNVKLHAADIIDSSKAVKLIRERNLPFDTYFYVSEPEALPYKGVDGILILTWPNTHFDITMWAASHGIPVFVEKPVVLPQHLKDLEFLYSAWPYIFVIDHFMDNPAIIDAEDFISSGNLGRIERVHGTFLGRWPVSVDRSFLVRSELNGGGIGMDLGVHTISGIEQLLESQNLSFKDFSLCNDGIVMARYQNAPERGDADTYLYIQGQINSVPVTLRFGNGTSRDINKIIINGDNGTLIFNGVGDPFPSVRLKDRTGRTLWRSNYPDVDKAYFNIVRKIFDTVQVLGNVTQSERTFRLKTSSLAVKVISEARDIFGTAYAGYPFGVSVEDIIFSEHGVFTHPEVSSAVYSKDKKTPISSSLNDGFWHRTQKQKFILVPTRATRRIGDFLTGDIKGKEKAAEFAALRGYTGIIDLPHFMPSHWNASFYDAISGFAFDAIGGLALEEIISKKEFKKYLCNAQYSELLNDCMKLRGMPILSSDDFMNRVLYAHKNSNIFHTFAYLVRASMLRQYYDEHQMYEHCQKDSEFQVYRAQREWIEPYSIFHVLYDKFNGSWWLSWPAEYRGKDKETLSGFVEEHKEDVMFYQWLQWAYHRRLLKSKDYIRGINMRQIADMALYPAANSADAWWYSDVFDIDFTAGAPGDEAAPEEQDWGMFVYKWLRNYKEVLRYKTAQIEHLLYYFPDGVRLDHVWGFSTEWNIPRDKNSRIKHQFVPADIQTACLLQRNIITALSEMAQKHNAILIGENVGIRDPCIVDEFYHLIETLPNFIATNIIGWRSAKATVTDDIGNIKKERDIIYLPYGDIVSATCADTYMRFKERWTGFDDSWKGPLTDFLLKMGVDIDINEYTPRELEELVEAAVSRAHISMVSISRELGLDYFYYNVPGKQDPKFWTGRIPQTFDDLIKQEKTRREDIAKIINSSDITEHFYVEGEAMAFAVEQGDKRYIVIKNNTDRKQEGMAHIRFPESNKPFVLKDESLLGENIIFVPGKNVFDSGTIYFKLEKQQGHIFRVDLLESTLQSANSLFVKAVTPKESISDVSCKASSALLADDRTNKKYLLGILMVLFCAVLISFKPFLVTKGLYEGEHLSPLTAQANYYIYSFLVLLVYRSRSLNHYFKEKIWNNVSPNNKAHFMRLTYKERTILLAGIFLGQFVASPFTYLSWAYTSPIITEVIVKAAPIIVAFLAALFFHEILTYKQGIGIGICFLGAMGVIFGREMSGLGEGEHLLYVTPAGLIFAVISCIGYSFSEIVKKATRGFKDKFGVIDVLFWSYLISSPIMIIAASLFGGGFRLIINWYIIGIVAISLLSLLLSYKSLDYLKVSVSKSINNTSPVFVLIISTILFPTSSLSILSVMGVVLTVIGVTIVSIGGNGLNGIVKADTKKADSTIVNRGSKHVTLGKPNNSRKKREVIRITSFSDLVYNRLETKKVVFGLDLGCGVGDKTALIEAMLIDRFENVIFRGVDNSEERVAEAIAAGNHVDYFNAEKLKQDTKLDLITVLSPMPGDLPAFINIAQKHIKPDGLVIISLASRDMRSLLKNEVLFGQITSGYVWQIFKDFDLVQFEGMGSVLSVLKAGRYAFVYPGFGQSNIPESISSPASFGVGFYHAITARAMFEAPGIYPFLKRYSDSFRYLGLDIHRIVSFLYAQKIISHSIGFLPNDFVIAYHRDGCMFWSDEINAEGQTAKEEIVRKVADCLYKQGNLYFTPDIIIEQIKTHEFMPTEHKAIHAQWNKFRLYDYQKTNRGQTVMAFTLSGAGKPIYFHKKNHFTPSHNLPSGVVEYLDFGRFILFQDGFSFENISYYQGPAIMAHGGTVDGVLSVNEIPLSTVIAHLFDVFSLNISRLLILSCNRFNGIVSTFLPCVYSTGMINDTRCRIPLEAVLDLKDTPYEDSFGGIVESFHLDQNDWYVVTSAHGDNWRVDDLPLKDQAEKERFGEGHLLWNVKALRELGSESLLGDDNRDIFYFYHEDEESSSSLNMENYFRSKNIRDIIDIAHLTMPGMDSFDEVLFAASLKELKHRGLKIIAITSSDDTTDHLKFFGSSLYDLEDIYYLSDLTHIVEALSVTFDAEDFIRMTAGNVLEHINMGSCVITAQSIDDSYGRKDIVTVFDNGYGFRALKGEQRSIRTVLQLGKTLD